MAESTQQKLSRVRPPRVQITYDVETGGAIQKKELPFIVGILADLAGQPDPDNPLPKLKERKFVEIDRDNFDAVLEATAPRIAFRVPDRLKKDSTEMHNVLLNFTRMSDFDPVNVVKQIPALNDLFVARNRLNDLLAKLDGNDHLDAILSAVLADTEQQKKLRGELTLALAKPEAPATPDAPAKPAS
ncbi:MAG TPA: type VI secretion system contractile sheath small subunit [Candidatus Binataceae bacterium]|nr:type VI secretion system contractile sheath small subunit [Candidatus Binataceae bacterium]